MRGDIAMDIDMLVSNGKVVIPKVGVRDLNIGISGGKIVGLFERNFPIKGKTHIDVNGKFVLPGVIESHTHIGENEYLTETKSAAAGGVTTLLNYVRDIKGDYSDFFERLKEVSQKQAFIDFSPHFGLITQKHLSNLSKYISEFGISSFKFFMNYRGEEGKHVGVIDGIDDGFMFDCFLALGKYNHAPACIHAENIEIGWYLRKKLQEAGRTDLAAWEENKPDYTEAEAIRRALYLGEISNCPIYIVHVSSKKGLDEIREFRETRYKRIYAETCTHYLTLRSDSGIGVIGKTSPPLRYKEDVESLWKGVIDGTINTIASDHVPRKKETKRGTIWEASGGYPGVATLLPLLLSEGVNKRGIKLERIAELVSYNVAKIFNLYPRKGTIEIGSDADLTIIDLDLEKEVKWEDLYSLSDYTVYEGWKLKGWPIYTIVRGKVVMEKGEVKGEPGYGQFIPRFQ
jgi:dihydropyrimidinase